MIDDAHGSGISGEAGRGPCSNYLAKIDLLIGTFGKALGSFGAYALCSEKMRHYLINFCRSFIYTTSLPPAVLEANRAVIELLQTPKGQEKVDQLQENISFLSQGIQALGLECPAGESAIFPLIVGGEKEALLKAEALLESGIFCQAIRPPTVPAGTSRLRLTITAEHTMEDLKKLLGLLKNA